ncbi:hypothetical protein GGX14DRAFT_402215 [Mycena pura]|uniref:Uncharacterized protein n=1 Tax=Mycena pura TaxID=153505 RepID=A0AAD6V619_9AGAR|nr:hypothetical protein GGX14DRAFT_402215 [Mycena pura]
MSLVVVALSTLTVHGLAPAAAPAAVTKSNNGTSGATVGTNDTAGRSGIIQACISDNYEGCLNVEFVENMCTYLPYPKTMSSVKVPKNWICTFDDEHCSGNFWTVVFDDLPAMWHRNEIRDNLLLNLVRTLSKHELNRSARMRAKLPMNSCKLTGISVFTVLSSSSANYAYASAGHEPAIAGRLAQDAARRVQPSIHQS